VPLADFDDYTDLAKSMKSKFNCEPSFRFLKKCPALPAAAVLLSILAACSDVNAGTLANFGKHRTSGQLIAAAHPNFLIASHGVAVLNRGFDSNGATFLSQTEQRPPAARIRNQYRLVQEKEFRHEASALLVLRASAVWHCRSPSPGILPTGLSG
jgi:hypothetical protein